MEILVLTEPLPTCCMNLLQVESGYLMDQRPGWVGWKCPITGLGPQYPVSNMIVDYTVLTTMQQK